MRLHNPDANPLARLPDVPPSRIPRHIAIIMDGNGRWAKEKGFPRQFGHLNGARSVRENLEECVKLGVEALTLYSFSLENWKRPKEEVDALMELCIRYLDGEQQQMVREGVRLRIIGRREGLPADVLAVMDRVTKATEHCRRVTLCLAVNYGSRAEITDAVRKLAERVAAGELTPSQIDEAMVSESLYTAGMPDPDLLIRTAGEMRVSNYLLWQISYAELHVTSAYWPDFGVEKLHEAIRDFSKRSRRFGAIEEARSHA
ncbi:MAG: isoprenyl transferase [Planctomycetes bacterium]|nr:isoprenyl transferase [Planctomycetota bacterium]